MPDISIIIISFNTKDLTVACIKSILEQKDGIKKEIIVVDNGSADGSVAALRKLQLKIIENKENLGFAKANNQAMRKAKGKYIMLLNSDTVVKPLALKRLVDFADDSSCLGAVVPRLLNSDGSIQPSVFRLPSVIRAIKQYWLGEKGVLDKYYPREVQPTKIESAVMAAFLITQNALKKAGLLNEKYFMYYEDLDYCRALGRLSLPIYYLPDAEVFHYHGASGKNLLDEKNQWRRLIPSSKIYHGVLKHFLINFIIWSSQKCQKLSH